MEELNVENLKKCNYELIAIFNENNLVDLISKDLNADGYLPYSMIGSDEISNEERVLYYFQNGKYYMCNAENILTKLNI